jgi:putative oxidoreductase
LILILERFKGFSSRPILLAYILPRNGWFFAHPSGKERSRGAAHMDTLPATDRPGPSQMDAALLLIRLAAALAFLYHGGGILFGMFRGPGPVQFAALMHMPVVVGYLVGLAQVAGGLAILTGILIRVGAASVIVVMLGAIFLVHLAHGFDINAGGIEYALTQMLIALALLLAGAGRYSLTGFLPPSLRKL